MNTRWLMSAIVAGSLVPAALAQTVTPSAGGTPEKPEDLTKLEKFVVTGSLIKRIEGEGALPVQTFSRQEIDQLGIASAEQLIMELNINGNGLDNLAGNADVVAGAQRGNNGATAANLRGQGSNATLVLLNGRRIASYGLNGGVVDLNSVPFAAIQRVEVLKDGASAIYGTDAIGGVINFITRTDYTGFTATGSTDMTEEGGGEIYRYSFLLGFGELSKDKYNIMVSASHSDNRILRGDQRDFVNTFQPNKGLSPDTRGTPIATVFAISSLYSGISLSAAAPGTGPVDPANAALNVNGINYVDLPGGPGYKGLDGMGPYDEVLWNSAASKYGSAWDTGRAAVIQQPVKNDNVVARGTFLVGQHKIGAEVIVGRSKSTKSFSSNQWSSSTAANTSLPNGTSVPNPLFNLAYPSTGADYNRVFNALVAYFPAIEANRGRPLAFRWRSTPVGNREYTTTSDTYRYLVSAEGPLGFLSEWEYRAGASRASSKAKSLLTKGYVYSVGFTNLINAGIVNPFSYTQTPEAMAAIDKVRADNISLYGGKFTTDEADLTASGPLFRLGERKVMAAIGADWRQEKYFFAGDNRPNANTADALIFNAPFDNTLATAGTLKRDIYAGFAEVQVPILKQLDLNAAVRTDHYTGFGYSTNPKYTIRYQPFQPLLFRASYSTGFRVPTFKQMFDPRTEATYVGNDFADPKSGTTVVSANNPAVHPLIYSGGKSDLQPEEADMYSAGFVIEPNKNVSLSVDWWSIERDGSIQLFGLTQLAASYNLFTDRFIRDAGGNLVAVDTRWLNTGRTQTEGIDYALRGNIDALGGKFTAGFDLSYLLKKRSKILATSPYGLSEINQYTRSSDIGIRWKHTAFLSYRRGNWSAIVNNTYRGHYKDALLPGVANGTVKPPNFWPIVKAYNIFGASASYRGFKNMTITGGIKNLFNTDPPYSATYDTNTGAGSSWEPRVADPRGRSYTLQVEYKFF